jgi:hypothetical protein
MLSSIRAFMWRVIQIARRSRSESLLEMSLAPFAPISAQLLR